MQSAQITILYEAHNNRLPADLLSLDPSSGTVRSHPTTRTLARSILSKSRSSVYDAYFRACFMPRHEAQLKSFFNLTFPQRRPWNFCPPILNRNFNNGEKLVEEGESFHGFTRSKGNPGKIDVKIGNCSRAHETERKLKKWKGIEKTRRASLARMAW